MASTKFDFNGLYNKLCQLAQSSSDYAKSNAIIKQHVLFDYSGGQSIATFHKDFAIDARTKTSRYSKAIALLELLENPNKQMMSGNMSPGSFTNFTITDDQTLNPVISSSNPKDDIGKLIKEIEQLTEQNAILKPYKQEYEKQKELILSQTNVLQAVQKELEQAKLLQPVNHQIVILDKEGNPNKTIDLGEPLVHFQYEELLQDLLCRNEQGYPEFMYGYGAPGCGKTKMGEMIAKAIAKILGKKYPEEFSYYHLACTPQTTEGKIVGFKNQMTGEYVPGAAYLAYKHGGLFALDEVDKSDASMLAGSANSLENSSYMFGTELVQRHPDFFMVAWANTKGTGAKEGFASNKLDAATLDRFTMKEIKYDEKLEQKICRNKDWAIYCQKVREYIKKHCPASIYITTRAIRKGDAYLQGGRPVENILRDVLFKLVSEDMRKTIESNIGVYKGANKIDVQGKHTDAQLQYLLQQLTDDFVIIEKNEPTSMANVQKIKLFRSKVHEYHDKMNTPSLAYSKRVVENWVDYCTKCIKENKIPAEFQGLKYTGQ